MTGDPSDMAGRIRTLLPQGWFSDDAAVLNGLLQGLGAAWTCVYGLIQFTIQQARISTASGIFLDMISADFFGGLLPRLGVEQDASFLIRIKNELLRLRGTRAAVSSALEQLTGRTPIIFEPALATDTGGYCLGGVGYAVAGGWGSILLPFQMFITAYRPASSGIAQLAGYATGGVPVYGGLSMEPPQILDANIFSAIVFVLPAATIAWTRISN